MNINSYTQMKLSIIKHGVLVIFICTLVVNPTVLIAQKKINQSGNSILLSKADLSYHDLKYSVAAGYYEAYLKDGVTSPNNVLSKLADCYWQMRNYEDALRVYKVLYPNGNKDVSDQVKLRIGELYARSGHYSEAAKWLTGVSGYQSKTNAYNSKEVLNAMKKDSANWKLGFLNINTPYREFSPSFVDSTLIFSSNKPLLVQAKSFGWDGSNFAHLWRIPVSNIGTMSPNSLNKIDSKKTVTGQSSQTLADVYECGDTKSDANIRRTLVSPAYLSADKNAIGAIVPGFDKMKFNAGAIAIDQNHHFYFSANYDKPDKEGINRIRLMEGVYSDAGVTSIHSLPFGDVNSYSVMHPAINRDGTLLVFCSDKVSGNGGYDLYYAKRQGLNQPWSPAKAFSDKVNTAGNEVFPSITADNYLYFSSDAIPGLGGLDIFKLPLEAAVEGVSTPVHVSYPVNSAADDFGWAQGDGIGLNAFFTSDRLNSNDNLYSVTYFAPRKSFIEGYVLDKATLKPVKDATVFLYSKQEDSVYVAKTDASGKYHFPVLITTDVVIKAVEKTTINDCLSAGIMYDPQAKDTIQTAPRDLLLDYKVGFAWKLSNIHYDFNKFAIRPDAAQILDTLVAFLKQHPIKVELGSHTDARGSFSYNERLSQQRAEAAVAYLVAHGVDSKLIIAKGYGEYQLLNKCADGVKCSERDHQSNRRTEVKVPGFIAPQTELENIDLDKFKAGQKINKNMLPNDFFDTCK
ncbi:MAG TPA: OmpA family protein [Paludibacter sp.]